MWPPNRPKMKVTATFDLDRDETGLGAALYDAAYKFDMSKPAGGVVLHVPLPAVFDHPFLVLEAQMPKGGRFTAAARMTDCKSKLLREGE